MTEFFIGRRSIFNYAIEDVKFGTPNLATTFSWPGYVQKWAPSDKQDFFELNPMDDTDADTVGEYYPMVPKYGGTLEMFLQHGRFAAQGIGGDTIAGTNPYTHTIALANILPSFSMQIGHHHSSTNFGKQYVGCTINKIDWNFPKGDWVRTTFDIVAQNATKLTSYKAYQGVISSMKKYTASAIRPYKSSDATFTINGVDISPYVTQAKLGLSRDLDIQPAMDTATGALISQPVPQVPKWEAGITVRMKDSALWDLFKAGSTVNNCSFKLTRGSDSFVWTFSGTKIVNANEPIDIGGGIVIQDLALKIPSVALVETNAIDTDYDTVEA